MRKVHIFKDKTWHVELDGVDITTSIRDGGVRVEFREHPLPPIVSLELMADVELDLPEAEVTR